jgi:hypothetical protein
MKITEKIDGIYMVEPFLVGFKGHYYNYVKSLYNIVDQKKLLFKIFVPKNCATKITETIPSKRVFEKLPDDSIFNTFVGRYFTAIFKYNFHMYNGLKNISNNSELNNKLLFFGTIQHVHVFGLIFWLLFTPKSKHPAKIVLTLRLSIYRYDIKRWSLISFWYIIGFNLLFIFRKKYNIKIISDSDGLVNEFSKITKFHIELLPIPHTSENINIDKLIENRKDNRVIFTSIGEARINKGFKLIYNSIEMLSSQENFNNILFKLHCYHKINDKEVADIIQILKEKNYSNVELIENNLTEEEYYKLLINSDVILIPYDYGIYAANTSGIFTESLSFGKVVVVTKGTWASNNLSYGSGLEILDQDYNQLVDAIQNITIDFEKFKDEATSKSMEWNKYHNPDNFLKMLISL